MGVVKDLDFALGVDAGTPVSVSFGQYDVIVGAAAGATHATLAAAVADSAVTTNKRVLLLDALTVNTTVVLSKAGWRIYAVPGATLTKGSAATALQVSAARVELWGLRFSGFSTSGNKAVEFLSGGTYGRVCHCNFASCDTEVDDTAVAAGSQATQIGNITE